MIRETSREAYHHALDNGSIGRREKLICSLLYDQGPMTANSVSAYIRHQIGGSSAIDTNTCARMTKLRDMGALVEVGQVQDPISGRRVILWDITENQPVRLIQRESNKQKIARLEKEIVELRAELISFRCKESAEKFPEGVLFP